jgi:hypothetical protein
MFKTVEGNSRKHRYNQGLSSFNGSLELLLAISY